MEVKKISFKNKLSKSPMKEEEMGEEEQNVLLEVEEKVPIA